MFTRKSEAGVVVSIEMTLEMRVTSFRLRGGLVDIKDLKSLCLCGKTHTEQGVATKRLFSGPI